MQVVVHNPIIQNLCCAGRFPTCGCNACALCYIPYRLGQSFGTGIESDGSQRLHAYPYWMIHSGLAALCRRRWSATQEVCKRFVAVCVHCHVEQLHWLYWLLHNFWVNMGATITLHQWCYAEFVEGRKLSVHNPRFMFLPCIYNCQSTIPVYVSPLYIQCIYHEMAARLVVSQTARVVNCFHLLAALLCLSLSRLGDAGVSGCVHTSPHSVSCALAFAQARLQ